MKDIVERLRLRCAIEFGEQYLCDAIECEAAAYIERLRDYVRTDARCPCCDTTERCEDDCTFASDCPVQWQRMVAARQTLGVEVGE
jgi:hypothetical protein